jgi:small subunit ribosomal protein S17
MMEIRNKRKTLEGIVVSDKMDKTVVVRIDRKVKHKIYKKVIIKSTKLKAHDEKNESAEGDKVIIDETRPTSRHKRWRVVKVVERKKA